MERRGEQTPAPSRPPFSPTVVDAISSGPSHGFQSSAVVALWAAVVQQYGARGSTSRSRAGAVLMLKIDFTLAQKFTVTRLHNETQQRLEIRIHVAVVRVAGSRAPRSTRRGAVVERHVVFPDALQRDALIVTVVVAQCRFWGCS